MLIYKIQNKTTGEFLQDGKSDFITDKLHVAINRHREMKFDTDKNSYKDFKVVEISDPSIVACC